MNSSHQNDVKFSRSLSWILRHGAPSLGLNLTPDAYLKLDDVLRLCNLKCSQSYTTEDVIRIVQNNNKQRFRLKETDGVFWIRANQGHSIKDIQADLLLRPLTTEEMSDPFLLIIHGTTKNAWENIKNEGLSRRERNHIHFATGLPRNLMENSGTSPISGMRSSSEILIYVNGLKCAKDGIKFYQSDNGVILTAGIDGILPIKYFAKVVHAPNGMILCESE